MTLVKAKAGIHQEYMYFDAEKIITIKQHRDARIGKTTHILHLVDGLDVELADEEFNSLMELLDNMQPIHTI